MAGRGNPNWKSGQSGNPSGRPKDELGILLRTKDKLPQEIYDAVYPLLKSKSEKIIMQAAEFLRDSAWGKPMQIHDIPDDSVIGRMLLVRAQPSGNGHVNGNGELVKK